MAIDNSILTSPVLSSGFSHDVPDNCTMECQLPNTLKLRKVSSQESISTCTTCSDDESLSHFSLSCDENWDDDSYVTRSILKTSKSRSSRKNLKASFSTLEIREYDITLGDNPGGSQGPPLTLDWKYNKRE